MAPPNVLQTTLAQITKILKSPGCRRTPVFVKNSGMSVELARDRAFVKERVTPVFLCSNVTGAGLDPLKSFLNALPDESGTEKYPVGEPLEFSM
jgi:GTPase